MDAIVVAGGRSSRLGRPKQDVVLGGSSLLERTIAAVGNDGTVVVVGPPRDDLPAVVLQAREQPSFGGPVAALAAGLAALDSRGVSSEVLVLACDMPLVDRVVAELRRAGPAEAVLLRDRGRVQPLAARFDVEALRGAIAGVDVEGASMRSLVSAFTVTPLDVVPGLTDDIDTADDLVVTGAVADHVVSQPYLLRAGATVADAERLFADDHLHAALLVDEDDVLVSVVLRADLDGLDPNRRGEPLAARGRLDGRTVAPHDDAELVRRAMVADGDRRLAVVDAEGRLLGLLCLKRTGLGFCSDAGVRARRQELAGTHDR